MKEKKTLLFLFAMLLVCLLIYGGLSLLKEKEKDEQKENKIQITKINHLTEISYQNSTTTMTFIKKENKWVQAEDETVELEQSYFETMEKTFGSLQAVRELKNGDSLEAYGLKEPAYEIHLKNKKGDTETIYVGDAAGEDYYVTTGGKKKIYTAAGSLVTAMQFDINTMLKQDTEE